MPSRNLGEIKQQVSAVWKCCGSMGVCAVRAKNLLGRRVSALAVGPHVLGDENGVFLQMQKFSLPLPSACLDSVGEVGLQL